MKDTNDEGWRSRHDTVEPTETAIAGGRRFIDERRHEDDLECIARAAGLRSPSPPGDFAAMGGHIVSAALTAVQDRSGRDDELDGFVLVCHPFAATTRWGWVASAPVRPQSRTATVLVIPEPLEAGDPGQRAVHLVACESASDAWRLTFQDRDLVAVDRLPHDAPVAYVTQAARARATVTATGRRLVNVGQFAREVANSLALTAVPNGLDLVALAVAAVPDCRPGVPVFATWRVPSDAASHELLRAGLAGFTVTLAPPSQGSARTRVHVAWDADGATHTWAFELTQRHEVRAARRLDRTTKGNA